MRERPGDVPLLIRYFVRKFAQRMNRHIEPVPTDTMNRLMAWSWPGNVRELENLMERSVILSQGNVLRVSLSELVPAPVSYAQPDQASQADHTLITPNACTSFACCAKLAACSRDPAALPTALV